MGMVGLSVEPDHTLSPATRGGGYHFSKPVTPQSEKSVNVGINRLAAPKFPSPYFRTPSALHFFDGLGPMIDISDTAASTSASTSASGT